MEWKLHRFDLPLKHPFTISRGTITVQPTLVVELSQDGQRGFGEATENSYYGHTLDSMSESVSAAAQLLSGSLDTPEALWARLQPVLSKDPFALCAIDQAAHDLWGKLQGQPVYRLWGLDPAEIPATNYTIGIDTIDTMLSKMAEFPDWPVYKIKLGTDHDLEIVRALRAGTSSVFRVDANCGWTAEETIRNSHEMRALNVEFIEQPLPPELDEQMPEVRAKSALPLVADESCQVEADVARCHQRFDVINIKLVKCGGLTPARRMIADARRREMQVMVGCMTESSVGISAIAQLLPELDYVDMDGALLLERDIARGVSIEQGWCKYPAVNGCGVTLTGFDPIHGLT